MAPATRQRTATLTNPDGSGGAAVAFSLDDRTMATSAAVGHIYLWDVG